jgi:hypothetical protein
VISIGHRELKSFPREGIDASWQIELFCGFVIRSDAYAKTSDANNLRTQTQSEVKTIRSTVPHDDARA